MKIAYFTHTVNKHQSAKLLLSQKAKAMPEHFFDALSSNIFPWPISPVSSVIAPNHISPELSNDFQKTEMNPAHANSALVEELKASLKDSTVVTPESESYEKSIERWSEAAERKAVRSSGASRS